MSNILGIASASLLLAALLLAPIAAPLAEGGGVDRDKPFTRKATDEDKKDVENFFDDLFGGESGDSDQPVIKQYQPSGSDVSAIALNRSRSLGIFRSRGYGLIPEEALNTYVNDVLRRLLAKSPERGIPARAYVVSDRSFNAAAAPDGGIYLNLGMIRDLSNEDELAFILAHELAHVILRHHGSDWYVDAQRKSLVGMALAKGLVEKVSQFAGGVAPGTEELQAGILIATVLYELSDVALAPHFTREQEAEADILGLDIMIEAGFNMAAAISTLEKIGLWEKQQAANRPKPKTEAERDSEMNQAFQSGGLDAVIAEAVKGLGSLWQETKTELKTDHYPAEERIALVEEYSFKHYLELVPPDATDLAWQAKDGSPETAPIRQLFAGYDSATMALEALKIGDLKLAEKAAKESIVDVTHNDAFPRLTFYKVRKGQGKDKLASKNLEFALESPEPSLMLYDTLIRNAMDKSDWNQAVSFVEEARQKLADTPYLLPFRIELYRKVGREQETPGLVINCTADYPELAAQCQEAAGGQETLLSN